jgi:hypothetical protein
VRFFLERGELDAAERHRRAAAEHEAAALVWRQLAAHDE